jgi:predicted ATPase
VPTCLCWLAAGDARLGRQEAGLRLLDEAQEVIADTGESYFAAEVHRVAGELNLALERPDSDAAEVSLRASLSIARRQRAKLLELRAGVSLARLWCHRGRRVQSRDLLARLCGSFASGTAGRDLTEARTLLAAA